MVVDFEISLHNRVKRIWSQATIVSCIFHLTQAWWRHIQYVGQAPDYKDQESECRKWLHYVSVFVYCLPTRYKMHLQRTLYQFPELVTLFAEYLLKNYIGSEGQFPPTMWVFQDILSERTRNAYKGFHIVFGKHFNMLHQNISIFICFEKYMSRGVPINQYETTKAIKNLKHLERQNYMIKVIQSCQLGKIMS